ncbi:Wzz/FepE/Etk N-terminal domain-containing protein [Rhodospirillaceae bacterium SYSU D60014]|uniref:GumC family protein n=1 Tax=Virgifigura deserti TaxID=2268457 RepID=UPI0013C49EC2
MNTLSNPSRFPAVVATSPSDDIDIRRLLRTVWRHKLLIVFVTSVLLVLSHAYITSLTPLYTAEAVMVLDIRRPNILDIDPIVADRTATDTVIRSEVDILRSRSLARRVVQEMGLLRDPEFNPRLRPHEPGLLDRIAAIKWVPSEIRAYLVSSPAEPAEDISEPLLASVTGGVLNRLTVVNDGRSYTIRLRFESEDAEKAARIVNAFADLYLTGQLEAKYDAAERGAVWLENKIGELRERVQRAENKVVEYQEQNSLVTVGEETPLTKLLTNLSNALIETKTDVLKAQARLGEVQEGAKSSDSPSTASIIASSPLVQGLRAQIIAAESRLAQLRSTYRPTYPTVVQAEAELNELKARLQTEIDRVLAGVEGDARVTEHEEETIAAHVKKLEARYLEAYRRQVELTQLQSEAAAARSLFDTFVGSLDRTTIQLDLLQPDARVLSRAEPPSWPSYPQREILLALAATGSLLVSLALVTIKEMLQKGFHNAEQVEKAFGVPVIGMIPLVKNRGVGRKHPSIYALQNPLSAYTESIRLIRTRIQGVRTHRQSQVVLVTSALPDEGKTELSLALGRLSAASGQRVMLIECDLRRPSIAANLGIDGRNGLAQALAGETTIKDVLQVDERSGMLVIPAGRSSARAIELLISQGMDKLIRVAAELSDLVILDAPPVTLVTDPIVLSGIADTTLLAVRWGRTPRPLVATALKKLAMAEAPMTGIVLSQVNLSRQASYGFGDVPNGYLKSYLAS